MSAVDRATVGGLGGRPGTKPDEAGRTARADIRPAGGRWRLLIVDDETNVIASLRRLLRSEPYELITAESAEQALKLLECEVVQLIISDERMPGMSGTEFLREVRRRWPDTVRIVLSGYSAVHTILAAVNDGAVYKFLTKPWNDEELKISIRRALEQHTLEAENRRMAQEIAEQNARLVDLNAQLAQRVDDATTGLDSVQELLDCVDAGVLTVDESGLVVGANRRAREMLAAGCGGLIGLSTDEVFPAELCAALAGGPPEGEDAWSGRLKAGSSAFDWRARRLGKESSERVVRGTVVTLWEGTP